MLTVVLDAFVLITFVCCVFDIGLLHVCLVAEKAEQRG